MNIDYGKKNIYKNSILTLLYKGISILLSLISAPLMLQCLGNTKYGIWTSLLSIISWIYYFDAGIGSGLRNKLSESLATDDIDSAKKYIGVSYALVSIISAAILILATIILNFVNISSLLNFVVKDENINVVLIVAIAFACINFVGQMINNILFAIQKASQVALFSMFSQVLFIISLYLFSKYQISFLLYIAIADGASQLIKNIISTGLVFYRNKELKFSFRNIDFTYSHGILSFGLQMLVVQLAALILNSTDNLIILKLFGADAVTPYSFCFKVFNIINTIYVALITPLLSAYTAAKMQKNLEWIKKAFKKNIVLYLIFATGTVIVVFLFKPMMHLWLNKDLDYQYGLILLMALYFILLMFCHIYSTFLTGIGKIKEITIATCIQAIVNIPVSVFLALNCNMEVNGVILGSIISVGISVIVSPIVSMRYLKKMF